MIQTLVQEPRMTVVSAFASRIIAELMRRHEEPCQIELVEFHPGLSARGGLLLYLKPYRRAADEGGSVRLHLGGPSGTATVHRHSYGAPTLQIDFLGSMLSDDPAACIDRISGALQLPIPSVLPPSSTPTLFARLIADVLAREITSCRILRTTSAWFDSSVGCNVALWLTHFGFDPHEQRQRLHSAPQAREFVQAAVAPYVALHECGRDESNLHEHPSGNAVLLGMNARRALLISGQHVFKELDLPGA